MKEKLNVAEQLKKKYHKTEEVTNFKDMLYRSCDIYRNRTAFKLKNENDEIVEIMEKIKASYKSYEKDISSLDELLILIKNYYDEYRKIINDEFDEI